MTTDNGNLDFNKKRKKKNQTFSMTQSIAEHYQETRLHWLTSFHHSDWYCAQLWEFAQNANIMWTLEHAFTNNEFHILRSLKYYRYNKTSALGARCLNRRVCMS